MSRDGVAKSSHGPVVRKIEYPLGIFIFRREDGEGGGRPLLSEAEREALFAEGGETALTGKGIAGDDPNASPELRKLLKGRSAETPF